MSENENQTQMNGLLSPFLQMMRIRNAKPHLKGKRFLEVGSSLGEIIKHLPEGSEYVGIEGNTTYYNNARAAHPETKFLNLYLDKDNVKNLDIEGKFDTIIMLAVIEHVDFPGEILKGLRDYLADDGVIIISTPNKVGNSILNIGSKFGIFSNEMDEHRELFNKERLFRVSEEAGFKVVHYHTFEFGLNHLLVISKNS